MQPDLGADTAPFFSVILPTFNRAKLLGRAVESAVRQTFPAFELLIIDDGSRDETYESVRPIVLKDARLRYHYASNRGLAVARNLGIQMSQGAYITFLDSDDEYAPTHLALRAKFLQEHPETELLHGGLEIVGDPFVADKHDPSKRIHLSECVVGGTFVIRRDLLARLGGFHNIAYGDDSDLFERATKLGARTAKLNDPTYRYYRDEPDSLCAIVEREGVEGIKTFRAGI